MGIRVTWVACPQIADGADPSAPGTPAAESLTFDLNVVAHSMTTVYGLSEATLGFAYLPSPAGRAFMATIFYDRVKDQAEDGMASVSQILAYTMAHELGHLLLRTAAHTSVGVMRSSWTAQDLRCADRGSLAFTTRQGELMRARVREWAPDPAASPAAIVTSPP